MSPTPQLHSWPASGGALTVPAIPQRAERAPFPLVASIAPIVAACAIWLLTQSPFVLFFAALGPVVAVAGLLDGRRRNRRAMRRATARFDRELAELGEHVDARHSEERRAARILTPSALDIAAGREDPNRWQGRGPALVSLGCGPMPSTVRLDSAPVSRGIDELDQTGWAALGAVRELCDRAETVADGPVTEPVAGGIGVVGPAALARPVVRGLLLQLLRAAHPASVTVRLPHGEEWQWADVLPHCSTEAPTAARLVLVDRAGGGLGAEVPAGTSTGDAHRSTREEHVLAVAESVEELPPGCQTILRVESARSALILRSAGGATATRLVPELLGRQQAAGAARRLALAAGNAGLMRAESRLPEFVRLHALERFGRRGPGLDCVLGVAQHGPIQLDLVAQGPHALIGGTTGSGKSELLVSWVLSLAASHPPSELSVLLVDFKGGSAFGELARLPHCVGLLTDLDAAEAARALASLQAELRHRERTLRAVRARAIDDPAVRGQLPRLVIVVDEFAAMLGSAPDLHAVFVDIAARGRSLGMHLILCTQRPAGVVRDALLANCALRLSLRVNNRQDSRATVGTDAAALLPPGKPGRAIVAAGDGRLVEFQSAISGPEELERAGAAEPVDAAPIQAETVAAPARSAEGTRAADAGSAPLAGRRPWLPPLPDTLTLAEVSEALLGTDQESGTAAATPSGPVFTLGIVDEPDRQRRRRALWAPAEHGPLLILGAARSGRSSVLGALTEQALAAGWAVRRCRAEDPEGYWDALVDATEPHWSAPEAGMPQSLLMFDDWDAVLARWPAEYQAEASEMLGIALRDGPRTGRTIVVAAHGLAGAVQHHRALFDATLLLRQSEKGEHLRAGGRSTTWRESAPAGRGEWRGLELQCASPRAAERKEGSGPASETAGIGSPSAGGELTLGPGVLLVVSSLPSRVLPGLRALAASADPFEVSLVELGDLHVLPAVPSDGALVIVGDPDAWQARWGLFAELRPRSRLVFHECRLADFRTLARLRELPPLLTRRDGAARGIEIDREGRARRVLLG